MTRIAAIAFMTLGACSSTDPQPNVRTYGILQPLCIIFCEAAVETVDGDGASAAPITQSESTNAEDGTPFPN